MQECGSIMCEYFCIGFIDFMLKGKSLLEYTNLFSPNEYKKNDKVILNILISIFYSILFYSSNILFSIESK